MKRLLFAPILALACFASAQSPTEYLRLRHEQGITQSVKQEALDSLIGSKICELDGTVKGTFKISYGSRMIQLERPSGDTVVIEADALPEWMTEGEVRVRLIVRATRDQQSAPLRLSLLASTTEQVVAADKPKPQAPKKQSIHQYRASSVSSRGVAVRDFRLPASQLTPYYSDFIRKQNPRLSKEEADRIAVGILGYSMRYGLNDPRLVVAIIMEESGFDPHSTSRSGAMGLGQLMPGTAKWMGVDNAYDELGNIKGCVKLICTHLRDYYRQTGDWGRSIELMLAAYNAGEGAVRRHGGVPPYRETVAYIRHVYRDYRHLCGYE